jgi:uncharacterized protein YjiS (DUF1127 family)
MPHHIANLWHRLLSLTETRPEMRAVNRLSQTSDEHLAAQGLTRAEESRRIRGARYLY